MVHRHGVLLERYHLLLSLWNGLEVEPIEFAFAFAFNVYAPCCCGGCGRSHAGAVRDGARSVQPDVRRLGVAGSPVSDDSEVAMSATILMTMITSCVQDHTIGRVCR